MLDFMSFKGPVEMVDSIGKDIVQRVSDTVSSLTSYDGVSRQLTLDDSLVDNGFSSLAMVDLMLAVECAFDMTIPQQELFPANFVSIRTLSEMLVRLCSVPCEAATA